MIAFIKDNQISLQISLDGNKETHDANRKFYDNKGSFDIVLEKLLKLKKENLSNSLIISLVFTPENVNYLYDNIKFILDLGFYNISTSICSDYEWITEKIEILEQQAKMIGKLYIDYFNNNIPITISAISNYIENTLLNFSKPICGAVSDYIAILPNGDLLPCGGFVGCFNEKDITIGNIKTGIIEKKVNFYLDKENIDALNINKACSKCKLLSRCQHNCFAINNRVNHNRNKTGVAGCIINKIFIMESDQVLSNLIENNNSCFMEKYKTVFEQYRK